MTFWETLSDIVRTLLIMSATGSSIALVLFIIKPIVKNHIPKTVQYYLWMLVLVAFLVPFSKFISLPFLTPMVPLQEMLVENVKTTVEMREEIAQEQYGTEYSALDTQEQINIAYNEIGLTAGSIRDYALSALITMGGVAFFVDIIQYAVYAGNLRRRRSAAKSGEVALLQSLCKNGESPRLYRNALVYTPMLVGIFRPAIYLPDREYSDPQLHNIMRHELTHLRRHDVAIKWISAIVVYVHWFNPISYFVRREINKACELACDEAVIADFDNKGKQSYGDTLIEIASDHKLSRMIVSTTMCEEKKTLKERLGAIMKSKKATQTVIKLSCVLLLFVFGGVVLLGSSSNYNDCSTLGGRELRLRQISNLGAETTISQELMIDDYIISGYTTKDNRYGLAVFAPDGNRIYRFQTNINRVNDELVFMTVNINNRPYNVLWANKADLDYAEITYTVAGNMGASIKLDATENKIIYTDAPSNDFSAEFYFVGINGNRYE